MYKMIECKENWKRSIALQTLPESIQVQHYVYLHIHLRRSVDISVDLYVIII